ncbi:THO complex subunit 4A-like isoform X2 [Diospyros lotus]|uniref:THO complex subunit 4A-like isoform X2 n=1 Tax=Diospyros lotus TaxID=55363 RepID=UPI00225A1DA3|nr:THO complex subunit 4A-like isoform X2 [Diospyros lotus]
MSGSGALDMTLDDLIKSNRQSGRGGGGGFRGRGGASTGPGPARRIPIRGTNRTAPYPTAKAPESVWKHDLFTVDQAMAYSVQELFSEVGDLKRYSIHYDRSGRSKGTAEVVFSRRQDALSAVKRYNNVQLDGKPMKIEIVGTHIAIPRLPPSANDSFGNVNGFPRSAQGRGGASGRGRGGRSGGRGFGRGRGRGRGRGEKISAEDLDSDLEKYHSEAMQTDN